MGGPKVKESKELNIYKKDIVEMIKQISDEKCLRYIYIVTSDFFEELNIKNKKAV